MFTVHGASGVDGTQFQLLRKMEGGVETCGICKKKKLGRTSKKQPFLLEVTLKGRGFDLRKPLCEENRWSKLRFHKLSPSLEMEQFCYIHSSKLTWQ